jgi:hypothetical protein
VTLLAQCDGGDLGDVDRIECRQRDLSERRRDHPPRGPRR